MKYIKLFENYTRWHRGSTSNTNKLGYIWLTIDMNMAEVYSHINFSAYGGDKIISEYIIKSSNILDLLDYDMDEQMSEYELEDFLSELDISYDGLFDLFDFTEDTIPLSRLVNKIVKDILDNYDGFTIRESEIETICIKTECVSKISP